MQFLTTLYESGQALIEEGDPPAAHLLEADLLAVEAAAQEEVPGTAPGLDLASGRWATGLLYCACQGVYLRHLDAEVLCQVLRRPCPSPPGGETTYSVDLAFRFLPSLTTLASHLAPDDPLVEALLALAQAWPLSSVGMERIDADRLDLSAVLAHPGLRQLYVDRIVALRDRTRASHPAVRDLLAANLGHWADRFPDARDLLHAPTPL